MLAILLSAAVTCFCSLFLGQAALRLAGAREWNWLAPPVGLSLAMLLALPTAQLPGKATTTALLLAVLAVAAGVWCLRSAPHRPPLGDLMAVLPVAFLALVPFLAAGRGGVLGVTVNNDMAVHLKIVESILSSAAAQAYPVPADYPLGPHAMAAALSRGLSAQPDLAFTGWTLAMPLIIAWTALAAARRAGWIGKAIAATLVGMPFLVAAYYGQGAFKEVVQAGLVLAVVLYLSGCGPALGRNRWIPFAILVGGVISAYSLAGLAWVLVIGGLWFAGLLADAVRLRRLGEVPRAVRRELPALGLGLAALILVLLPQATRMREFLALGDSGGIAVEDIGNLVGRLPGWEALGIWSTADFRLPGAPVVTGGAWSWFVVALILFGAFWALRRGRWMLPLAAGGALLIWKYSDRTQSIYVAAKALVIASPLLMMVAALPLIDREERPWPRRPKWAWLLVPLLGLVLVAQVVTSDLRALRFSPVGPMDHARQLTSFRPFIAGEKTLMFGADEFNVWELAGSKVVTTTFAVTPQVPFRPGKEWEAPQPVDFDSLSASTLNEYRWFVTTRDAAASTPPPQLHLVKATEAFELWKRSGRVRERAILDEGEWPGARLRCDTGAGRRILAGGGVAAVRRPPIVATGGSAGPGTTGVIELTLPAGSWDLVAPYVSHRPVEVTAPGLKRTLPANLERFGQRLPIGRIHLDRRERVTILLHVTDTLLAPLTATATLGYVAATPADEPEQVLPLSRACGRYVDWYRASR